MAATIVGGFVIFLTAATAGSAIGTRIVTKNDLAAILAGVFTVPALFLFGLLYFLSTMEVDDAPPGMVIGGTIVAAAIAMPATLLVSFFTVRHLDGAISGPTADHPRSSR